MGEAVRSWGFPKWSICRHRAWKESYLFTQGAHHRTSLIPNSQCPMPNAQFPIPNSPYHMPRIEFVRLNTVLGGSANDADRET
jgi:hypothetical protein